MVHQRINKDYKEATTAMVQFCISVGIRWYFLCGAKEIWDVNLEIYKPLNWTDLPYLFRLEETIDASLVTFQSIQPIKVP